MTSGTIFDIKRYAINDGPGIRTAIFFKGCPLNCWWCHNPEGKNSHPQLMYRANRCNASQACLDVCPRQALSWTSGLQINWDACDECGKCAEVCYPGALEMVGRTVSVQELMREIERDIPFYDQSGGGVTFTGGEPMYQRDFLVETLLKCKEMEIHTALDTSGYSSWHGFERLLSLVDLFLYDLKLMDADKHLQYTGVPNRIILNNLQKLSEANAHIIVRIPLLPGINDDKISLDQFGSFLENLPSLDGVELMPYHEIGIAKYESLGIEYMLNSTPTMEKHEIESAELTLARYHLPVISHFSGRLK